LIGLDQLGFILYIAIYQMLTINFAIIIIIITQNKKLRRQRSTSHCSKYWYIYILFH